MAYRTRKAESTRIEKDTIGALKVPYRAYYGIQTVRAIDNFPISALPPKPSFISATACVKKASCLANLELKLISGKNARAIIRATDEILKGRFVDQFVVDVYQAGAGTSHNMNANEVIANRANEILGYRRGAYSPVHPNDHVNMSQSTNDTVPTAMRIAAVLSAEKLLTALSGLAGTFNKKAREFKSIVKSGRTHLQDATPVTLGQEFASYGAALNDSAERIKSSLIALRRTGLGGTATGTGVNTHPRYRAVVLRHLKKATRIKNLSQAPDNFSAQNSMADFLALSNSLSEAAVELIRISNDLRLLSSGPRTGLAEITLPAVQPGSSIMPGKVNPVMAEMLAMVCFQVIGNTQAISFAAQAGQLELNVMGPVINHNLLHSIEILTNAIKAFGLKCVTGIRVDKKKCAFYFERSVGLATLLNRIIGYEGAASIAKSSIETGRTVRQVAIEKGIMTEKEWKKAFSPERTTSPVAPLKKGRKKP